jgi:glyoxylase-like metal-dependent hydrolase (beta-lactamase superfamily II)
VNGFILLDASEKDYLNRRPRYVFITHFHSDHAALAANDVPKDTVIYAPESTRGLPVCRIISEPCM